MWCLYFNSFIIVACSPKEPWDLECTLYAAMLNPYFRTIIAMTTSSRLVLFKQTQWPWFSGHVCSSFEFSISRATVNLWNNLHLRLSSFLVPPNHYCFLCLSPTQILCPFPAPLPNCLAACQLWSIGPLCFSMFPKESYASITVATCMCNPTFCVSGSIHTAVALRTANSVQMDVDESIILLLWQTSMFPFLVLCVYRIMNLEAQ